MKNSYRLHLTGLISLLITGLYAQPCPDINILLKKADSLLIAEEYRASIGKLTIARDRCPGWAREIDTLILIVFQSIEKKRDEAEKAEQEAIKARERARVEQKKAEAAKNLAEELLKSLQIAKDSLQNSANRTDQLQKALSDKNALQYIWQQANSSFRYDPWLIRRNYQNALTYFALTNFLERNDKVEQMIHSCQSGLHADAAFRAGELDTAEVYYQKVINILTGINQDAEYEKLRLHHIEVVRLLEKQYRDTMSAVPNELVLSGNWWTIPRSFYTIQSVTRLTLHQNPAIREDWPFLLQAFAQLESVRILNCPNLTRLQYWSSISDLANLEIIDNDDLEILDSLDQLRQLSGLHIIGNSRLKSISGLSGLHNLKIVDVRQNKRLSAVGDLSPLQSIQQLTLTDIEDQKTLNLTGFHELKNLNIDRLPRLWHIRGLENLPELKSLTISHTAVSPGIGKLSGLDALTELSLTGNDSLTSLAELDKLPALQKIRIDSNYYLTRLPVWRKFPGLQEITLRDNVHIHRFHSLYPLKKLKKAEVKGNKHLFLTTVGIAPGWIFGGYHASNDEDETFFSSPALTLSASAKMLQLALHAEYTIFNRDYFPTVNYPYADRCDCEDFFKSIRAIDRLKYKERGICNVEKHRFRLMLKYDVYPYFPIGPVYYIGLGVTMMNWHKYAPVIAGGAQFPLKYNYLSLDWRLDFAEIYKPFDRIIVQSFSLGYNVRLGYKKTSFRESNARKEASFKPKRLF